ncbi:dTDP-4-dehydrorhamnose reductase [Neisseria montereyensis]|uniref:dTDP-4-dehydrorhamnose reductase n=1 Tax=Neisseria montereyensis TaxID=2973938 RepID=A0ABT2FCK9_9NEIS|nr:dTDP-4-dehydrorhamnose reductase [Neisseria montereyensis]MCS4533474.1 dTDP-4-dehydrorhamnose reductase [Neisseria montereyensis]
MRILLTGSKGQLGRCFKDRLPEDWELIAADSATLNITDAAAVMNMAKNFQPDVIVNTAAYTDVDKAEKELEVAFAVNSKAVHNLATAASEVKARFVHVSTDYVFGGLHRTPYTEVSPVNPSSIYGKSKLSGELLALAANPQSLIIRTAWVFSEYGNNFVKKILAAADTKKELPVVDDQYGCPTYAGDLAQTIIELLEKPNFSRGLYHYCGAKPVSWYEFAKVIIQEAAVYQPVLNETVVKAVNSDELSIGAPRPAYSVLDCSKILMDYNIEKPDWQKGLKEVIQKLNAQ